MKKFSLMFLITVMSLSLLSSFKAGTSFAASGYASTLELMKLSHYAYFELGTTRGKLRNIDPRNPALISLKKEINKMDYPKKVTSFDDMGNWSVVASINHPTGMDAIAFQNARENEVVIAFRGTSDIRDINTDVDMTLDNKGRNRQVVPAKAFVQRIAREFPYDKITLTGHSLGGWLAQNMVYHINEKRLIPKSRLKNAETFNAPGFWNPNHKRQEAYNALIAKKDWSKVIRYNRPINYVTIGDPVSHIAFNGHIGQTIKIGKQGYHNVHSILGFYGQRYTGLGYLKY
ncbi:Mbeg1-like protein [Paenibacillus apiarius]|uniref:Lipase family protein n=1 Tax=Paenibacillus apiarius TaxID=46240 RepID=A0ABT4DPY0_9BACL|nr:Mbeg1-like protein [Paenibacillus apiarius]MCY9515553.1 lipase family protein [Paenibacillus apiarius]MCY9519374.1 lipase family protein [Paenibacillus apiarius]MCY9551010.1 lipase family protein [Paenibacillus apiarius]MCY9558898.1 lipase family protein [Paenibacillus apiarius]MCY9683625.1 lipase family protein [Paenibacillus apiarius]